MGRTATESLIALLGDPASNSDFEEDDRYLYEVFFNAVPSIDDLDRWIEPASARSLRIEWIDLGTADSGTIGPRPVVIYGYDENGDDEPLSIDSMPFRSSGLDGAES